MSAAQYQRLALANQAELKTAVTAGFDQLDRGEISFHTADEIAAQVLQEHLAERT